MMDTDAKESPCRHVEDKCASMLANRIKRRPLLFTAWLMSAVLFLLCLMSFRLTFFYFGGIQCVLLGDGCLLFQNRPVPQSMEGLKIVDRNDASDMLRRIHDFYLLPHHLPKTFCVPLGWPLSLAVIVFSWLFWRRLYLKPFTGHCLSCGYDLRSNMSGVCPECGVSFMPIPGSSTIFY